MAIALVQVGTAATNNTTASTLTLTPTCASAMSASNLAVLVVELDAGGNTGVSVTTPSGWTLEPGLTRTDNSSSVITSIFYCTGFSGTSQAVVFNAAGGATYYATSVLLEYSGVNNSAPTHISANSDVHNVSLVAQTLTGVSATPTISSYAISIWGANDIGGELNGHTTQSGWTEDFLPNTADFGTNYAFVYVAHQTALTTSGTAVVPTLNIQNPQYTSPEYQNFTWILAPATTGNAIAPQSHYEAGLSGYTGGMN
jgi:hypothetical protein